MKSLVFGAACVCICLVGCEYVAPLSEPMGMKIDGDLIGTWKSEPSSGSSNEEDYQIIIRKHSDTEYLIHIPDEEENEYHRGYPIKIAGISCIQLKYIGETENPKTPPMPPRFNVVSYEIKGDRLVGRVLNDDYVPTKVAQRGTKALQREFEKHKEQSDLFLDAWKCRRQK